MTDLPVCDCDFGYVRDPSGLYCFLLYDPPADATVYAGVRADGSLVGFAIPAVMIFSGIAVDRGFPRRQ